MDMATVRLKSTKKSGISGVHIRPTAPPDITNWLSSLGRGEVPVLTVEGNEAYRRMVYGWCSAIEAPKWQQNGIRAEVVTRILLAGDSIFTDLLKGEALIIEEPLRSMVDQRFYLISGLFRVLLEARFQVNEGMDPKPLYQAIFRWILDEPLSSTQERLFESSNVSRIVQPTEQLDLTLFLVALATQSGVINRLTLSLDNVEQASLAGIKERRNYLRELDELVFACTRWEKLGCTLGIILGVERLSLLNPSPKLGKLLNSGAFHRPSV